MFPVISNDFPHLLTAGIYLLNRMCYTHARTHTYTTTTKALQQKHICCVCLCFLVCVPLSFLCLYKIFSHQKITLFFSTQSKIAFPCANPPPARYSESVNVSLRAIILLPWIIDSKWMDSVILVCHKTGALPLLVTACVACPRLTSVLHDCLKWRTIVSTK